ncbi:voltage-dependent anion channel-domain-containing protein [Macrophomina phaseolina]|uniref:Voltage-dependent anion channel-domain-containing protein n=1 Tax=Macrophomina phaseolina TaxID=35725 RepID=A0ABQ8GR88_9PEZI|nr:voltage-dependent anion channel-domain-containing protein [Macrophomina phaseolina]
MEHTRANDHSCSQRRSSNDLFHSSTDPTNTNWSNADWPDAQLESGYTTEADAQPSQTTGHGGVNTPRWIYSQCPTPHQPFASRNPSVLSLPQRKKITDGVDVDKEEQQKRSSGNGQIGIRDRIQHLTWGWFTTTMSTGGLALALGQTPHQFSGLRTIGKVVFIFDLVLFVALAASLITRFTLCPRALKASLSDASEAFFFPAFWLSLCTIIANSQVYGASSTGLWLETALRVTFWCYAGCSLLVALVLFVVLFNTPSINAKCDADSVAPTWVLPIFPVMLCGTLSGLIAPHQPPNHALAMIVAGISFQGLGWLVSCAVMALYLLRLFHAGLMPRHVRPGMFMMVGPPSFTALALIGNANALPASHEYFAVTHPGAQDMLLVVATWIAIFLWSLAFWFFGLALISCLLAVPRMQWTPSWWAYVFPNVGFTVATIDIGKEFDSEGILWVASIMTVALVVVWLFVASAQIRAVVCRRALWPGKDDDREEPHVREAMENELA